jgi:hypothetical protein
MKLRIATIAAAALFAAALSFAADTSLTGWISDSNCGAKGAKYVFVNDADQKVYAIDAQDQVAAHAGHHVTVKGDVKGDAIKLSAIEMAPEKGM